MFGHFNITNANISTTPGQSATVILWDSTWGPDNLTSLTRRRAYPKVARATVRIFADQACTFFADDLARSSVTFRAYNNGGSGDATVANTWFEKNVLFVGDDHRLRVTTPAGAITVWEVSVKLWMDPGLAQ